jgi:hypothetical protein
MNLHETLTNGRSIAHAVPIAFRERRECARRPALSPHKLMASPRRHHTFLIGIAALIGVLLLPVGASAATCDYRDMLDAAANNRQITQHTPACYEKALSELPADVDNYLPAARANLIAAMRRDDTLNGAPSHGGPSRTTQGALSEQVAAVAVRGPVTDLLAGLGPAHVDEVPTPVVALGGAAAVRLLAGLGTSLARLRSRRRLAG